MPASSSASRERSAPRSVLIAYAAPAVATSFVFTAVSLYLLKFSTDVLLLAPATIGLIFAVGRFWDAFTDPIVGHLSDRTRSRLGRRRPWLLAAALPVAGAYLAIWSPPAGVEEGQLALWMGGAILLFYTAITAFTVPYTALGAELSAGYHDRTRVFGAKAFGDHIGIVLGAASLLFMEKAAEPRAAAVCVATLAGGLMIAGTVWATAALREPAEHQGRGGRRRPHDAFADVLRNREARILVAVFFLEMLGYQTFVVMLPYLTEYVLETPGATAYYLFAAILTTLATLPVWVPWSRRFGKARVWAVSLAVKTAVFAGMALVGPGDWLLIGGLTVVFGAATGGGAVLGPSLKADVVDSDEARTGERKEGTFFAAWGLAIKMAVGFAILISGTLLSSVGFEPNVAQRPEVLIGIRTTVSALPVACHILALLLLARLRMNEADHAALRRSAPRFGPIPTLRQEGAR
ncbi:MAG: MFS transporter [Deltaproteobacteria bacterium]|nr:MFS transporter [Deltaproteobacteria bacterium]MBW2446160.1 MFS transporter [Deltaproteobacteria bacterium]